VIEKPIFLPYACDGHFVLPAAPKGRAASLFHPMTIIESARALLIDPQDRVLLMKLASEHVKLGPTASRQTFWLTPGGSLNPGESFEDALIREIFEETGLRLSHPGHWIWTSPKRILRDGRLVDTIARVYIQRVPSFEPMPTALTSEERETFCELRWWSIDEIAATSEIFVPRQLALLLKPLLTDAWLANPVRIVP
jgi:8-oxo-dGTP pyrophosphatase MutT (NUDIX family)